MQAQPTEHLLVERTGPTARIVLDRPDRYNALSSGVMAELRAVLTDLGEGAGSARSSSRARAPGSPPVTTSRR